MESKLTSPANITVEYTLPRKNRDSLMFNVNVDIPIDIGVVGIFGHSGTGKSTLLKALAGLIKEAQSSFSIASKVFLNLNATRNPFVYLGADSILFDHLNVMNNLRLVVSHSCFASSATVSIKEVINWCGIQGLLKQMPTELSSGEQQRVKFARALLCGKPYVLLDEAFSALDWPTRRYFLSLLNELQRSHGLKFIMVSHSLQELALCCQSIIHLHNGQVKSIDGTQNMLDKLQNSQDVNNSYENDVFSLLNTKVIGYDPEAELVECALTFDYSDTLKTPTPTTYLYIRANAAMPIASTQKFTINADKVSLASSAEANTSMLNCLQGVVHAIDKQQGVVLITLVVEGQKLRSLISIRSFRNLSIKLGDTLYALFKAL